MRNNFGIMFHHFCDKNHPKGQGAISAQDFENLLQFMEESYEIISADVYFDKMETGRLKKNEICITFDDGLRCQMDVAFPVLKKHNLKAFWFVYSSPLVGEVEKIEVYRHFRTVTYKDIDCFYKDFFDIVFKEYPKVYQQLETFDPKKYAIGYDFYTPNDKRFRFLRDDVLNNLEYIGIMDRMMKGASYDIRENSKRLWIDKEGINELYNDGQLIGLHSHTHPATLNKMSYSDQEREYRVNKDILESIIPEKVCAVSYPCNSYNQDTIDIMEKLDIKLGFRTDRDEGYSSKYELPREDHANIMARMMI